MPAAGSGASERARPSPSSTNVWIGAARDASAHRALDDFLAARGHRVVMLSVVAQELAAGRILAALSIAEGFDLSRFDASFVDDARIAAACREHRALLVTHNAGDFGAVQRHPAAFRFVPPWP